MIFWQLLLLNLTYHQPIWHFLTLPLVWTVSTSYFDSPINSIYTQKATQKLVPKDLSEHHWIKWSDKCFLSVPSGDGGGRSATATTDEGEEEDSEDPIVVSDEPSSSSPSAASWVSPPWLAVALLIIRNFTSHWLHWSTVPTLFRDIKNLYNPAANRTSSKKSLKPDV